MTLFQYERKPFHTYARSDWSIELPNLSSIVPVNSRNEEFSQFSIMADERDENFPNFDLLSGNDMLLPHNNTILLQKKKGQAKREDLPMWKTKSLTRSLKMRQPKKTSRQHSGQFPYSQVGFNYMDNLLA